MDGEKHFFILFHQFNISFKKSKIDYTTIKEIHNFLRTSIPIKTESEITRDNKNDISVKSING